MCQSSIFGVIYLLVVLGSLDVTQFALLDFQLFFYIVFFDHSLLINFDCLGLLDFLSDILFDDFVLDLCEEVFFIPADDALLASHLEQTFFSLFYNVFSLSFVALIAMIALLHLTASLLQHPISFTNLSFFILAALYNFLRLLPRLLNLAKDLALIRVHLSYSIFNQIRLNFHFTSLFDQVCNLQRLL